MTNKTNKIKISRIPREECADYGWQEANYYRLNMTVLDAFKLLEVNCINALFEKLQELGMKKPFMIVGTENDVAVDKFIDSLFTSAKTFKGTDEEKNFYNEVSNFMLNFLLYKDIPFEKNGKWGLRCTSGKMVVPALFDECRGASDFSFYSTMSMVKLDNQYYLTPRDGSGKILTEGYVSIRRSNEFAWVVKDGKEGILNAETGAVLIPCEMDWMAQCVSVGNDLLGKGGKLGAILLPYSKFEKLIFIHPEYDAIDLSTGQFQKGDKWGWVMTDGTFTERPPRFGKDFFYFVFPHYPLKFEELTKCTDIQYVVKSESVGVKVEKRESKKFAPKDRLVTLKLERGDVEERPRPDVKKIFDRLDSELKHRTVADIKLADPYGSHFDIIINRKEGIRSLKVIWEESDESKIAVDQAFPLIGVCRRILKLKNGRPFLTSELELGIEDSELAISFLSSIMNFRAVCSHYDSETWNELRYVIKRDQKDNWGILEEIEKRFKETLARIYEDDKE